MGVDYSDEASMDDFINPSEMHVEVGKPVSLKIRARDVLHSVYIPHMRRKMDAVPGMPTKFWFIPDKSTEQMRAELVILILIMKLPVLKSVAVVTLRCVSD